MSWSSDLLLWDGFCYSIFHPFHADKRLISDMIVIKLQLGPLLATWQLTVCAGSISPRLLHSLRVYEIMWWQSGDDHLHPPYNNCLSCLTTALGPMLLYVWHLHLGGGGFRFCHSVFDGSVTTTLFKYLVLMAADVEISETNRVCQWDEWWSAALAKCTKKKKCCTWSNACKDKNT